MRRTFRTSASSIVILLALGAGTVACGSSEDEGPTSTTTSVPESTDQNSTPTQGNSGADTNAGNGQNDGDSGPSTGPTGEAEPDPQNQGSPGDTTTGGGSEGTIPPGSGGG